MEIDYSIQFADEQGERNIETQDRISGLIEQYPDSIRKTQPTGALGVGEVLMVVIAVNSTIDLLLDIGMILAEIRSDTDAIVRIEHPENAAKQYLAEHTGTDIDDLELVSREDDGEMIEFEFSDSRGRTHHLRLNPFNPDLRHLDYEQEQI